MSDFLVYRSRHSRQTLTVTVGGSYRPRGCGYEPGNVVGTLTGIGLTLGYSFPAPPLIVVSLSKACGPARCGRLRGNKSSNGLVSTSSDQPRLVLPLVTLNSVLKGQSGDFRSPEITCTLPKHWKPVRRHHD